MKRPSLAANPIMGLTSNRRRIAELLDHHDHIYFSDLREVSTKGAMLTGKLFYGCLIGSTTFVGATIASSEFVCCAGVGPLAVDATARQAIESALRSDWEPCFALLRDPLAVAPEALEHVVAIAIVGTTDPRMEIRLSAMTLVARLLRQHPERLPADAREVLLAFLLYRAADDNGMLYFDAVALVDDLRPPPTVLEHLVGRAHSFDERERIEALVARLRMHGGVNSTEPPYPPLQELLDDNDPDVQLGVLDLLSQVARHRWDVRDLLPGVDIADKLNLLLRSHDDRVRRAAIQYARRVGGPANREALIASLQDPDPKLRDIVFDALYLTLFDEELRDFLLHHEPTPTQRAMVLEHEARSRENGSSLSRIIDTPDLRDMLASDDPRQRREALLLAGFTGDPALVPDVERVLESDSDPRVRAEAERLLQQLRSAASAT